MLNIVQSGFVATVTLNRPEVRNAFNDQVIAELTEAFAGLGARDDEDLDDEKENEE